MTGTGRLGQGHFLASPGSVDFLKIFRQGQCRAAKLHPPGLGRGDTLRLTLEDIVSPRTSVLLWFSFFVLQYNHSIDPSRDF